MFFLNQFSIKKSSFRIWSRKVFTNVGQAHSNLELFISCFDDHQLNDFIILSTDQLMDAGIAYRQISIVGFAGTRKPTLKKHLSISDILGLLILGFRKYGKFLILIFAQGAVPQE